MSLKNARDLRARCENFRFLVLDERYVSPLNFCSYVSFFLHFVEIPDMENPAVVTMSVSTPAADKAKAETERTVKLQMVADKTFNNLLKFPRLTMDVACKNQQLLTSK